MEAKLNKPTKWLIEKLEEIDFKWPDHVKYVVQNKNRRLSYYRDIKLPDFTSGNLPIVKKGTGYFAENSNSLIFSRGDEYDIYLDELNTHWQRAIVSRELYALNLPDHPLQLYGISIPNKPTYRLIKAMIDADYKWPDIPKIKYVVRNRHDFFLSYYIEKPISVPARDNNGRRSPVFLDKGRYCNIQNYFHDTFSIDFEETYWYRAIVSRELYESIYNNKFKKEIKEMPKPINVSFSIPFDFKTLENDKSYNGCMLAPLVGETIDEDGTFVFHGFTINQNAMITENLNNGNIVLKYFDQYENIKFVKVNAEKLVIPDKIWNVLNPRIKFIALNPMKEEWIEREFVLSSHPIILKDSDEGWVSATKSNDGTGKNILKTVPVSYFNNVFNGHENWLLNINFEVNIERVLPVASLVVRPSK